MACGFHTPVGDGSIPSTATANAEAAGRGRLLQSCPAGSDSLTRYELRSVAKWYRAPFGTARPQVRSLPLRPNYWTASRARAKHHKMQRTCFWCQAPLSPRQRRFCSTACRTYVAVKAWRRRTKAKAIAEKGGACARCGYAKSPRALTFHHPGHKSFAISRSPQSWAKIKAELAKCQLLCLNCHAEIHDDEHSDTARKVDEYAPSTPGTVPHGTKVGYSYHKCRCVLCRAAHAAAHRKYRASSNGKASA